MAPTPAPVAAPIAITHDATSWDWPLQAHDSSIAIREDTNKFEIQLDVQYFKPEEIDVKVAGDEVIIHCKHERRQVGGQRTDEGEVAREILRAYHLPKGVDVASVKSNVARGRLEITADKKH